MTLKGFFSFIDVKDKKIRDQEELLELYKSKVQILNWMAEKYSECLKIKDCSISILRKENQWLKEKAGLSEDVSEQVENFRNFGI